MPVGEGKTEQQKKRSTKKGRSKQKIKSKPSIITNKNQTTNPVKNILNCSYFFLMHKKKPQIYWLIYLVKQNDLNKLTPANLSSLRWDDIQTDPILENVRIEQYKELRRQRYINAQQQAIQKLVDKMKITISDKK